MEHRLWALWQNVALVLVLFTLAVSATRGHGGTKDSFPVQPQSVGDVESASPVSTSVFPAATQRLKLYVWHVTNSAAVVSGKGAPVLEERGPFVWARDVDRSLSCDTPSAPGTWCFYPRETFTFLANESCPGICQDADGRRHTVVSVSYIGVVANAQRLGYQGRVLMDLVTTEWKTKDLVFSQRSAAELAFGWEDELLHSLRTFDSSVNTFIPGLTARSTPAQSAEDAIAAGASVVRTEVGSDAPAGAFIGELLSWHGGDTAQCCTADRVACPPNPLTAPWSPRLASSVRGSSEGLLFAPGLGPGSDAHAWSPEALRSVLLRGNGTATRNIGGRDVECVRLIFDPTYVSESSSAASDNSTSSSTDGGAITPASYDLYSPPGLMTNFSRCNSGVPVMSTAPHFLFITDTSITDPLRGVAPPDLEAHATFAVVDPGTGITQDGATRAQVAVPLGPAQVDGSTWLPHLPRVPLFPVLWFELSGQVIAGEARRGGVGLEGATQGADAAAAVM
jgi:hypothetical protein